jgi:hypothetical protein
MSSALTCGRHSELTIAKQAAKHYELHIISVWSGNLSGGVSSQMVHRSKKELHIMHDSKDPPGSENFISFAMKPSRSDKL